VLGHAPGELLPGAANSHGSLAMFGAAAGFVASQQWGIKKQTRFLDNKFTLT
jgi:hypothetical protein